ncbi:GspE/PulE family protein [Burkholderia sp. AW49-1]
MNELAKAWYQEAQRKGTSLDAHLVDVLGSNPSLLPQVAEVYGLIALEPVQLDGHANFDRLGLAEALAWGVLPVRIGERDYLVIDDPHAMTTRNWCQTNPVARRFIPAMSLPGVVRRQLQGAEGGQRMLEQFDGDAGVVSVGEGEPEISLTTISQEASTVVRLVDSMLIDALGIGASDVHVESVPEGLVIKYRIDGVLQQVGKAAGTDTAEQTLSRLKVLSELDISERRVPQDGRFKARIQGRNVDFRVSIMPSIHGEDAVLRVLDKTQRGQSLTLDALGLEEDVKSRIRVLVGEPYGMVLVTGPTGSGKSTTLYAALSETHTGEKKIITIEDPVEYELPGILQIPVNEKKGLTFARGLRSILRHDPDTILVGEIRDSETATIAVQAALTGHLVLSSVHTNTAFSVLERFLYMGVEPASFVEALQGVVSQRLIRRVCKDCAVEAPPDPELSREAGLTPDQIADGRFRTGKGCSACRGTGYAGRIALAEVLAVDDALKKGLLERASAAELRKIAMASGHVFMRDIALRNAVKGITTLQEIHRVIPLH